MADGLDEGAILRAVLVDDPTFGSASPLRIEVAQVLVNPVATRSGARIDEWWRFDGVVLGCFIYQGGQHKLEGSAVLVAPGIALAARHVTQAYEDQLREGNAELWCIGLMRNGPVLWSVQHYTCPGDADIAILGMILRSPPPPEPIRTATLSTRLPGIGETLMFVGIVSVGAPVAGIDGLVPEFSSQVLASAGQVSEQYPVRRDTVMAPFPCLEVQCHTVGGMSGGPVFDKAGFLVGLLATSFSSIDEAGPSYPGLL